VPDPDRAPQLRQHIGGEDLAHQPHLPVEVKLLAIGSTDPGGLLAPMLERVET
jgi:hypothetical protein